jgi:hypothetical protein
MIFAATKEISMFIPFANIETSAATDWYLAAMDTRWRHEAANALRGRGREVAVGKLAEALQMAACEEAANMDDGIGRDLFGAALQRVDFYSLALLIIQHAEAADPSLIKVQVDQLDTEDLELELAA